MSESGNQDPHPAGLQAGAGPVPDACSESPPETSSGAPTDDEALRVRSLALAPHPPAPPALAPRIPPTDALDEDHVVLPVRDTRARSLVAAPEPSASAMAPARDTPPREGAALAVEAFFVTENRERTRRAIGVLLRADPTQAEDITQEAFVIVYERWNRVSRMDDPLGYTITVAWRLALKWLRARKRYAALEAQLAPGVVDGAAAAEGVIARVDLERAFLCLSHSHQEVLALALSGLGPQEIAPLLAAPVATVRTRLFRARKALSALLEQPREGQS